MKHKSGFTLIELLIVVAIIAILAASVIMILNPGERMLEARERTRESHMITIGNAIHLAVIDCEEGEEDYCAKVSDVVAACRVGASDWKFNAAATNCTIDDELDPEDPQGGSYFINNDGDHNVKIWAPAAESEWKCVGTATCTGATFKRF